MLKFSDLQALEAGSKAITEICVQIQEWAAKIGKPKRTDLVSADTTFDEEVSTTSLAGDIKDMYAKNLGGLINSLDFVHASRWKDCMSDLLPLDQRM